MIKGAVLVIIIVVNLLIIQQVSLVFCILARTIGPNIRACMDSIIDHSAMATAFTAAPKIKRGTSPSAFRIFIG